MSGWTTPDVANVAVGLFFVSMGVMNLLDPPELRASEAQLRHGDGGTDLRPARVLRWPWVLFILMGVVYMIDTRTGPGHNPFLLILMGVLLLAAFLWAVFVDPIFAARRQRHYEAKLAALAAESDSYTDELRALHASQPVPHKMRWPHTIVVTLFGGAFLALGLISTR